MHSFRLIDRRAILSGLLLLLTLPLVAAERAPLILISIDGFHPSYLSRADAPALSRIARQGVRARWMNPSYPSLTFPNHYTLVTGLRPDHHGIVNNDMRDAELGSFSLRNRAAVGDGRWWGGEPLWVGVRRAGGIAMTMFWPGSEAEIDGLRPNQWLAYDETIDANTRVDRVLNWLDLPVAERPRLITLYFEHVDHAGHDFGPDSAERHRAVRKVDAALARLVRGLQRRGVYDQWNLVVVSDHGMTRVGRERLHPIDDLIDPELIEVIAEGPSLLIAPKPGQEAKVRATLLGKHPDLECWQRAALPARWHYGTNPRIPDIVCQNDLGSRTMLASTLKRWQGKPRPGTHGYEPYDPDMRAIFIARGPDIQSGRVLPAFDNVDVYPLLTRLLGIPAAANDGDPNTLQAALRSP